MEIYTAPITYLGPFSDVLSMMQQCWSREIEYGRRKGRTKIRGGKASEFCDEDD